jgi:sterol desaturase/sphingolipid hydroxylase (fatty acid hydroxylase superfamily)
MIIENETAIRLGTFLVLLALFSIIEWRASFRASLIFSARWFNNFALSFLNTFILKLAIPLGAAGSANWAINAEFGLLNMTSLPFWLTVTLGILILDWVIWLQHLLVHRVPLFWRFHRVHHSDPEYDTSTALRFHPVEILLSMLIKITVISLVGIPVVAVILFEVILNGMALFNHSNFRLPNSLERRVNKIWVTPDFHRIHHSIVPHQHHSNFGFNLSIWDRLFGTCSAPEQVNQKGIDIGLTAFTNPAETTRLPRLLAIPFQRR